MAEERPTTAPRFAHDHQTVAHLGEAMNTGYLATALAAQSAAPAATTPAPSATPAPAATAPATPTK